MLFGEHRFCFAGEDPLNVGGGGGRGRSGGG